MKTRVDNRRSHLHTGRRSALAIGLAVVMGLALVAPALEAAPSPDRAHATRPSSSSGSSSSGSSSSSSGGHATAGSSSRSGSSASSARSARPRSGGSALGSFGDGRVRTPDAPRGIAGVTRPGDHTSSGTAGERISTPPDRRPIFIGGSFFDPWYWYGFGYGFGYRYAPWYGWWGHTYYGPSYGGGGERYEAPAEPGAVDLKVAPARAELWINGGSYGEVEQFDGFPDYLWLDPGEYELVFYSEGFETARRTVTVTAGTVVHLELRLEPGEASRPWEVPAAVGDQSWRER